MCDEKRICHSLWELADFVPFPAMSGSVVVFLYVLMFYLIKKRVFYVMISYDNVVGK